MAKDKKTELGDDIESVEKTELAESKRKKSKQKKEPKTISAKKLPKLFRKKYSKKKYSKKILNRIYVQEDKNLVKELFEQVKDKKEKIYFEIPKDKMIPVKDFKRLKLVAKQIKKQKGGIKFIPLVACLVFVSVLVLAITVFKNPLIEKLLVSSLQGVFKAKTDIEKHQGSCQR